MVDCVIAPARLSYVAANWQRCAPYSLAFYESRRIYDVSRHFGNYVLKKRLKVNAADWWIMIIKVICAAKLSCQVSLLHVYYSRYKRYWYKHGNARVCNNGNILFYFADCIITVHIYSSTHNSLPTANAQSQSTVLWNSGTGILTLVPEPGVILPRYDWTVISFKHVSSAKVWMIIVRFASETCCIFPRCWQRDVSGGYTKSFKVTDSVAFDMTYILMFCGH